MKKSLEKVEQNQCQEKGTDNKVFLGIHFGKNVTVYANCQSDQEILLLQEPNICCEYQDELIFGSQARLLQERDGIEVASLWDPLNKHSNENHCHRKLVSYSQCIFFGLDEQEEDLYEDVLEGGVFLRDGIKTVATRIQQEVSCLISEECPEIVCVIGMENENLSGQIFLKTCFEEAGFIVRYVTSSLVTSSIYHAYLENKKGSHWYHGSLSGQMLSLNMEYHDSKFDVKEIQMEDEKGPLQHDANLEKDSLLGALYLAETEEKLCHHQYLSFSFTCNEIEPLEEEKPSFLSRLFHQGSDEKKEEITWMEQIRRFHGRGIPIEETATCFSGLIDPGWSMTYVYPGYGVRLHSIEYILQGSHSHFFVLTNRLDSEKPFSICVSYPETGLLQFDLIQNEDTVFHKTVSLIR